MGSVTCHFLKEVQQAVKQVASGWVGVERRVNCLQLLRTPPKTSAGLFFVVVLIRKLHIIAKPWLVNPGSNLHAAPPSVTP